MLKWCLLSDYLCIEEANALAPLACKASPWLTRRKHPCLHMLKLICFHSQLWHFVSPVLKMDLSDTELEMWILVLKSPALRTVCLFTACVQFTSETPVFPVWQVLGEWHQRMCALEKELDPAECLLSHYYTLLLDICRHEGNRFFLSVSSCPLLPPSCTPN